MLSSHIFVYMYTLFQNSRRFLCEVYSVPFKRRPRIESCREQETMST